MNTRVLGGLAAAATAVVLLAGCSDAGTTTATPSPTGSAPAAASHHAADAAFVQGMLPHHRQAIEMSDLVAGRAGSPEVTALAAEISRAQGPEIEQMNGLLAQWDTAPGMPGMDHGAGGMSGMMSPGQMQRLRSLTGPAFDRAWLEMMIEHHTGAVEMARTELARGRNPEATALARGIIDAQQSEIERMQALLTRV